MPIATQLYDIQTTKFPAVLPHSRRVAGAQRQRSCDVVAQRHLKPTFSEPVYNRYSHGSQFRNKDRQACPTPGTQCALYLTIVQISTPAIKHTTHAKHKKMSVCSWSQCPKNRSQTPCHHCWSPVSHDECTLEPACAASEELGKLPLAHEEGYERLEARRGGDVGTGMYDGGGGRSKEA